MSISTHQVSIRNRSIVYIVLIKRRYPRFKKERDVGRRAEGGYAGEMNNGLDDGLFLCNAMNNAFLERFYGIDERKARCIDEEDSIERLCSAAAGCRSRSGIRIAECAAEAGARGDGVRPDRHGLRGRHGSGLVRPRRLEALTVAAAAAHSGGYGLQVGGENGGLERSEA